MNEPFRFKLLMKIPLARIEPVRQELARLPRWRVHSATTLASPQRQSVPLRGHAGYPRSGIAPASMVGSATDTPEFAACPAARELVAEVLAAMEWTELGLVTVSRMAPRGAIAPHIDGGAYFDHYHRVHIPLQAAEGIAFVCEEETVEMGAGEVWCFDNKRVHSVRNASTTERLNLYFDAR